MSPYKIIKYLKTLCLSVLLVLSFTVTKRVVAPIELKAESKASAPLLVSLTPPSISDLIKAKATQYGVSEAVMTAVVNCESFGSTTVQSYFPDLTGPNGREDSWGIAQWHLPAGNKKKDGTVITKEDALNAEISIDTMAWYFSMGWYRKWSCYTILYGII